MGRTILFVTTDQQRYDALGCNGGRVRTLNSDGLVCTTYEKGTLQDGSEGELYDLAADPLQHRNLWREPGWRRRRDDLIADLAAQLPPAGPKLKRVSPV